MQRGRVIKAAAVGVLALMLGLLLVCDHGQRGALLRNQNARPTGDVTARNLGAGGVSTVTRNVSGTVYLEDNVIAGATVRIVELRGPLQASRQTDSKGRFDFGAVAIGRYRLIAEVRHATGTAVDVDLDDRRLDADNIRLIAHACDASLHGFVRDVGGGAVSGARIFVSAAYMFASDASDEGPGSEADEDGAYHLCVPLGDSVVTVRADGYADSLARVSAFGRVRREFELVPEAVVSGRVVRASDGVPVAAAQLKLQHDLLGSIDLDPILETVSDADGLFRFRGVAPGQYSLSANADHLASENATAVTADMAIPADGIELKLVPTLSIAGRLVDKQRNHPVYGRVVWAFGPQMDNHSTTSASDGTFAFKNLAAGEYRITAVPSENAEAGVRLKLANTDVDGIIIAVDPLASVAGRVTRGGKPTDGARVRAYVAGDASGVAYTSTTTDADGQFFVRDVPAGSYRLYAESRRVGAFTPGPVVIVAAGEHRAGVEIEMNLAGSIAGRVADQADTPLAGAYLRFSLVNGEDSAETTTADDGTFKATGLSGGGNYIFEVRPTSDSAVKLRSASGTRFTPITVRDGDSHVTGVQIKVQFERLTIRGRVTASDGKGVPDVPVFAIREKGRDAIGPTRTDANGAFAVADLTAGKYNVYTRSSLGFAHDVGIAAGARNVELRLPPLTAIEGTFEGFANLPSVAAFSTNPDTLYVRYRATVTGNAFSIRNVPVGTYVVQARSDDGFARATAIVERAGARNLVLRNPGVGAVEGRVVDATTRNPVVDAECTTASSRSRTDSSGSFRFERIAAGSAEIACVVSNIEAHAIAMVTAGQTAHIELVAKRITRPSLVRGYAGLELEIQGGNVAVRKVVPGGPADLAGVQSGDVVREIDDEEVDVMQGPEWVLHAIEDRSIGSSVNATLERRGIERTVEIKVAPVR